MIKDMLKSFGEDFKNNNVSIFVLCFSISTLIICGASYIFQNIEVVWSDNLLIDVFELIKTLLIIAYVGGCMGVFIAHFHYGAFNPYAHATETYTKTELLQVLIVSIFWPIVMIYDIIPKNNNHSS